MSEQRFIQEVLRSSIPVLVYFGAPWCGPCRVFEPLIRRFQAEWDQPFKLVELNADQHLHLSSQYRIRSLPTLLFFNKGKLIYRLEGISQRDQLIGGLQHYMQMICQLSHASTEGLEALSVLTQGMALHASPPLSGVSQAVSSRVKL
jgi:thioredoxin 1